MLSNASAGRSKRRIVAALLEMAACAGAIGFFGCSSAETPSTAPGANHTQNTALCGNGVVDPGEMCDGAMLGGATCASATNGAFPNGTLGCVATSCGFDMSRCETPQGGFAGAPSNPPPPPPTGGGAGMPSIMPPPGAGGSFTGVSGSPSFGGQFIGAGGALSIGTGGQSIGTGGGPPAGAAGAAMQGPMNPVIPPAPSDCPQWVNSTITYGGLAGIQIAAGAKPASPSAPMLIYWHGTGGVSSEFATMAAPVATGVTAAGGVIVSFQGTTGGDLNSGTFIFGASDLKLIDNLVACAVKDHNIDPRKIYSMGCSAGGLMATATAALRSSYIAAASPNSGGFPVLTPAFENGHTAPLMTVHGKKGSDVVVIDFADASALADMTFKARGGFVIDCDTGGGHCGGAGLAGDAWKFLQAHPFGVSPEPWTGGLPAGFSAQCKIQ